MGDFVVQCETCRLNFWFGVKLEPGMTYGELRRQIVERLGPAGVYICPRCQALVSIHVGDVPVGEPDLLRRVETAHAMGKKMNGVRFGVGSPDGPRSAIWRLWLNNRGDDVYISARSLARDLKVSLHPDFWYFGFTEDHVRRGSPVVPEGTDRKTSVWSRPPEFTPGWTRVFTIVVPTSELVEASTTYDGPEVVWLRCPPEGDATHFTVLLSAQNAPRGRRGFPSKEGHEMDTEFITRLDLTTGERVWVLAHSETVGEDLHQRIAHARVAHANDFNREVMKERAAAKPTFQPRILVFGDEPDGARCFLDLAVSLTSIT